METDKNSRLLYLYEMLVHGEELQKKENRTLVLRCEVWYTIISRKDRKD